jgi:hypothetical protein
MRRTVMSAEECAIHLKTLYPNIDHQSVAEELIKFYAEYIAPYGGKEIPE